jgi:hypothetical protein
MQTKGKYGLENIKLFYSMIYFDMCIARDMFIKAMVRNRFDAFEELTAGKARQSWYQFPYIGTDLKQILWASGM